MIQRLNLVTCRRLSWIQAKLCIFYLIIFRRKMELQTLSNSIISFALISAEITLLSRFEIRQMELTRTTLIPYLTVP